MDTLTFDMGDDRHIIPTGLLVSVLAGPGHLCSHEGRLATQMGDVMLRASLFIVPLSAARFRGADEAIASGLMQCRLGSSIVLPLPSIIAPPHWWKYMQCRWTEIGGAASLPMDT